MKSEEDIRRAQDILKQPHASTTAEVQEALQLVDSAVHPETGEIVGVLFRRSAYHSVNFPVFLGIAISRQTHAW